MRKIILIILSLAAFNLAAQETFDRCGYDGLVKGLNNTIPGYADAYHQTFDKIKATKKYDANLRMDVYEVPIVFHIVYHQNRPQENIDDSLIQSQLEILNEDYRRMNADTGNLRDIYNNIVGDALIQFKIEQIIRVPTTKNFALGGGATGLENIEKAKYDRLGGSNTVDPEHFLNIWICKIQGTAFSQLFGFAYPPADLPNWPDGSSAAIDSVDGVLVDYRTVGRNNPFPFDFSINIKGRTLVHEVGHYLGLRHVWGDPIPIIQNGCSVDDGCDDTPNAKENSQVSGCNPTKNTCNRNQPGDLPDMWENYMDYSSEECQVAFTNDQITIMRGVLEGPRALLLETSTAITNVKYVNELLVFPNPSNGQIIVKAKILPINIQVFDLLGKLVFENNKPLLVNKIDLNTAKGIYFVKTEFSNGIATEKIIVE